jgi:alpha-glucosidase
MDALKKIEIRNDLNNRIGNLLSYEVSSFGLTGKTENAQLRITVYQPGIIRVQISRNTGFKSNPYSVISQPDCPDFSITDLGVFLQLSTSELQVEIAKNPFTLSYKTLDGKTINADDPAFGVSWMGTEVSNYKVLQEGERFIGLGEKTGNLDRRGKAYVNWNTDHFAYGVNADPLYMSTPFYMGLHHDLVYGIYFDNTHKTTFNFGASNHRFSYFSAENGDLDYYFLFGASPAKVLEEYTCLTGRMELPPLWSLGYQQCRYSYYPEEEILSLAKTFRDKDLPADVIYLDIHYMDKYKVFSFDPTHFPDPKKLSQKLKKMGFKLVVILDPGIKIDQDYLPYREGKRQDLFLKYPDGEDYAGDVWPGTCHFPDFSKFETRDWWANWVKYYTDLGIEGYWNDMNEPSAWGQHIPELVEFDMDDRKASLKEARNVYGLLMAKSTFEGSKEHLKGKRPFNLTRSGFSGIQRYAAVWTGDNIASDEHMLAGIRLVNSLGLTGISFSGFDLGGFAGESSPALFARWISIAAFTPFFRGHTIINSRDSEPWSYGEEVEEISRNYMKLRYRIMPYIYSAMYESTQNGMPLNRSLAFEHPFDEKIYFPAYQNQFLFGSSLLVVPVESSKEITKVYLPKGKWYQFFTDDEFEGGKEVYADCPIGQLPVYVKASSIIPMQGDETNLQKREGQTLFLHVYTGDENTNYHYFEDDGESYEYNQGHYYSRNFELKGADQKLILHKPKGTFRTRFKQVKIYFHGLRQRPGIRVNNTLQRLKRENLSHLKAISEFDPLPQHQSNHQEIKDLVSITLALNAEKLIITWK